MAVVKKQFGGMLPSALQRCIYRLHQCEVKYYVISL
jgi:hypothetical protein